MAKKHIVVTVGGTDRTLDGVKDIRTVNVGTICIMALKFPENEQPSQMVFVPRTPLTETEITYASMAALPKTDDNPYLFYPIKVVDKTDTWVDVVLLPGGKVIRHAYNERDEITHLELAKLH